MADEMCFEWPPLFAFGGEVIWRRPGVTDDDILVAMGIGLTKCKNYDRICHVINRDEERRELWKEVTSWQLSNQHGQEEVPTSQCGRDGLEL